MTDDTKAQAALGQLERESWSDRPWKDLPLRLVAGTAYRDPPAPGRADGQASIVDFPAAWRADSPAAAKDLNASLDVNALPASALAFAPASERAPIDRAPNDQNPSGPSEPAQLLPMGTLFKRGLLVVASLLALVIADVFG